MDNAEALLEKALNLGLVLEEDAFTGHIYFVDRIAPAYKRDWQDDRFGSDRSTAVHNAAFNGNIKAMIYLLRQGWHLDVKNIDSKSIKPMLAIETNYPNFCLSMIGLHPCSVNYNYENELAEVSYWLKKRKLH